MNNLPWTNEQPPWAFPLPLIFCPVVTLTPSVSMFLPEHQIPQHLGSGRTRDGQHQAVVPYTQNVTHELSGTIARDRPAGIHLAHVWMDANNARVSKVWESPQGNSIFPRTDRVDLSEYQVHVEDM